MRRYFTVTLEWLDKGRFPRSLSKLIEANNVPAAAAKAIRGSRMYSELKGWREMENRSFTITVVVGARVGVDLRQFEKEVGNDG